MTGCQHVKPTVSLHIDRIERSVSTTAKKFTRGGGAHPLEGKGASKGAEKNNGKAELLSPFKVNPVPTTHL